MSSTTPEDARKGGGGHETGSRAGAGDTLSDEILVAAMNRGDVQAFEVLYRRHRDWVVSLAWRFTRNHDDALDILQETFAYILRKIPGLRLEARMTTFLYPVVKHLSFAAKNRRKRFAVEGAELAEAQPAEDPPPEEAVASDELEFLLEGLSETHREVVALRFIDDLSLEDIAAILGVPVGTVKSRLHHAIAALRKSPRTRRYFEPP